MQSHHLRAALLSLSITLALAGTARAQSNLTGSVFGTAPPGTDVTIENVDTGQRRTVPVDATGRYRASSLPNGRYRVEVTRDGTALASRDDVDVTISKGTEVSFGDAAPAAVSELARIEVTAGAVAPIDITQVDTRTVFTANQLAALPVTRSVSDVALLAPGVARNTSYGANSFGGSASSENAYYINGYAITNPLTNIGSMALPFDTISQLQVLTGGYGAEFGRSTGGVVNLVTKRGGNEWKGGVYGIWSPRSLQAKPVDLKYPNTGSYGGDQADPDDRTDGTRFQSRGKNGSWTATTGAWGSGPLLEDRLFLYANVEQTRIDGSQVASTAETAKGAAGGWREYRYDQPRWAAKLDWAINDDHQLEFTAVQDDSRYRHQGYGYDYDTGQHGSEQDTGLYTRDVSRLYVGRYTGFLTDDLSLSATFGRMRTDRVNEIWENDPDCPVISSGVSSRPSGIPDEHFKGCAKGTRVPPVGAFDETRGGRLDLAWQLGNHDLRFGYDRQEAESFTGTRYNGGYAWVYGYSKEPGTPIDGSAGVGSPSDGGGLGEQGYYVRKLTYTNGASVRTLQQAWFLEDRWQLDDHWLLSLGLRNDNFDNYNGAGKVYVSQKNQWAPRLGVAWDVRGDASLKVFANAGRYHLALPNNVAMRGVSGSTYTNEYFTYTGVDPVTGAPTGLVPIPVDPDSTSLCPGSSTAVSANAECGVPPDPRTVAADGLKSHFQDEFIVGLEHAFTEGWVWGAKATYRDLKNAIDDTCVEALGGACFIFNPGRGNTFWVKQPDGSLKKTYFSAEELGLPKLKRRYYALDLFLERPFADRWSGRVGYTFSRSYGNTEGQLHSDLDTGSGGQSDVSATQDWDLKELMEHANGVLPNHRAHQLKAFGMYQWSDTWTTGIVATAASGRPVSCVSYYPTPEPGLYNGAYYHWCGLAGSGKPGGTPPSEDFAPSPRGSKGTTPATYELDLNVAWRPARYAGKVTLQADVFNVFDRQVPQTYDPMYADNRDTPSRHYRRAFNYTQPRSVRLSARYDF